MVRVEGQKRDSGGNQHLPAGRQGLVRAGNAKARGYRSLNNFTAMVYIVAGKLGFCVTQATHMEQRGRLKDYSGCERVDV